MVSHWALIVADFQREYQIGADELARMPANRFRWLLSGLSDRSRFRQAWTNEPKHVYDPADIEAVRAAARR